MFSWHRLVQHPDQFNLLGCIGIERGLDAVGNKGLQTSELSPVLEFGRVAKNLQEIGFVVAFEKHAFPDMASLNQKVERVTGMRSTVDVVAQIDFDRTIDRGARQVGVNHGEHLLEEIGATVDVADGINTNSIG